MKEGSNWRQEEKVEECKVGGENEASKIMNKEYTYKERIKARKYTFMQYIRKYSITC